MKLCSKCNCLFSIFIILMFKGLNSALCAKWLASSNRSYEITLAYIRRDSIHKTNSIISKNLEKARIL